MKAAASALKIGLDGNKQEYWDAVRQLTYWGKAWLLFGIESRGLAKYLPPLEKPSNQH